MPRRRGYGSDFGPRYGSDYRGAPPRRGRGYEADMFGAAAGRYGTPFPGAAGFPSARWGWGPIGWAGWGPGMEFWPYADVPAYGMPTGRRTPRRRPEQSPTYGSSGDRELRRWAQRYGYDMGYTIRPRGGR